MARFPCYRHVYAHFADGNQGLHLQIVALVGVADAFFRGVPFAQNVDAFTHLIYLGGVGFTNDGAFTCRLLLG